VKGVIQKVREAFSVSLGIADGLHRDYRIAAGSLVPAKISGNQPHGRYREGRETGTRRPPYSMRDSRIEWTAREEVKRVLNVLIIDLAESQ
jgi:hypothetical protein